MDRTFSRNAVKSRSIELPKKMPALNVEKLFDGLREIRLFHDNEEYRLRLTRNDKLILTK